MNHDLQRVVSQLIRGPIFGELRPLPVRKQKLPGACPISLRFFFGHVHGNSHFLADFQRTPRERHTQGKYVIFCGLGKKHKEINKTQGNNSFP